jgi:hypothetical protein
MIVTAGAAFIARRTTGEGMAQARPLRLAGRLSRTPRSGGTPSARTRRHRTQIAQGEAMGRTNRRTGIGEQFAPRTIRMLRPPAWCVLSLSARRILDRVEIELADHGGADNGKLPVTYDDFERYGIHRHAVGPAIREAVALGFLEITEPGRAGNAEWRKPNVFRLTYRNTKYGPTDEWEKTKTTEEAEAIARAARAARPRKIKPQWRKAPVLSAGNRHHRSKFQGPKTDTTCDGAETATTLDISGRDGGATAPEVGELNGADKVPAQPLQSLRLRRSGAA